MHRVAIVGGKRLPFVKSFTHYREHTAKDLLVEVLNGVSQEFDLKGKTIPEVILGAVTKHAQDWNLAREAVLGSELGPCTPAYDVQRACGTSFEACQNIANKIKLGQIEFGIGGGVDTNSDAPITLNRRLTKLLVQISQTKTFAQKIKLLRNFHPKDLIPQAPKVTEPRTGLSMGEHCELMVKEWGINRTEQDQWALESHQKAASAYENGFFENTILSFLGVDRDGIVRGDTTLEKLAKLRPAFDKENGSLTAGNSSPLTDGAAALLLASEERAKAEGWPILAYFEDGQAAAVDFIAGEGLLMAPTIAVAELLKRQGINFDQIGLFEIHEAFAGQVLSTLKAWESEKYCQDRMGLTAALGSIDRTKINPVGSSLAIGHPFAATGARVLLTAAQQLAGKSDQLGLISICTAGGMGVAGLLRGA